MKFIMQWLSPYGKQPNTRSGINNNNGPVSGARNVTEKPALASLAVLSLIISMPNTTLATPDCTKMSLTTLIKHLENGSITSVQCSKQLLARIDKLDPVDEPREILTHKGCIASPDAIGCQTNPNDPGLSYFKGLNAYESLNENFLSQAREADIARAHGDKRPLLGVPIAIKSLIPFDMKHLIAESGFSYSAGNLSILQNGIVFDDGSYLKESPNVTKLKQLGAIIIGKTVSGDLGIFADGINFSFGITHNGYNDQYLSLGTSTGSGAAVAAHLAPAALGNDAGGSIRLPASVNGIVGFRPSLGRWNNDYLGVHTTLCTEGPMTKTVEDTILLDRLLSLDGGFNGIDTKRKLKTIRIGIPEDFWGTKDFVFDEGIILTAQDAVKNLEAKGVVFVRTPHLGNTPHSGYQSMAANIQDELTPQLLDINKLSSYYTSPNPIMIAQEIPETIRLPRTTITCPSDSDSTSCRDGLISLFKNVLLPPVYFTRDEVLIPEFEKYMADNKLDAVLYPYLPAVNLVIDEIAIDSNDPRLNKIKYGVANYLVNRQAGGPPVSFSSIRTYNSQIAPALKAPAIVIPVGLSQDKHEMPVGMELMGTAGSDKDILEVALALEKALKENNKHH